MIYPFNKGDIVEITDKPYLKEYPYLKGHLKVNAASEKIMHCTMLSTSIVYPIYLNHLTLVRTKEANDFITKLKEN